ncbi:MAG: NifB/NifX family molybdenum-iron cluster-binding protein [Syntrophobacteraceae bacterium]|nr:NifB/NifX family molybdenum-iron cluster-binding protein [Syntrophobacteraceae bacterium]
MVAIPVFRTRVAPVLDWCSKILIVSGEGPEATASREMHVKDESRFALMRTLRRQGINTVICGALSPAMLSYAESLGFRIIHGIAGEIQEVLEAYCKGELDCPRYWLPGCRGQRRYKVGAKCARETAGATTEGVGAAAKTSPPNPGPEDKTQAGPGGFCVCPRCGETVGHERGIPCSQILCPACSSAMTRKTR